MMRFAKVYVQEGPRANRAAIARRCGISTHRVDDWFLKSRAFADWIALVDVWASGRVGIPRGWRAMAQKAMAGDCKAMHMLALRFDSVYRAAVNKQEIPSEHASVEVMKDVQVALDQVIGDQPVTSTPLEMPDEDAPPPSIPEPPKPPRRRGKRPPPLIHRSPTLPKIHPEGGE
jgi:hypothetical protein